MIDTKAIQRLWEIDHERRLKEANNILEPVYDSFSDVGEIRVYWRADFQSGSRVLKKVF